MFGRWQSFRRWAFSSTSGCSSFHLRFYFFSLHVRSYSTLDGLFKTRGTFSNIFSFLKLPKTSRLDCLPHHSWLPNSPLHGEKSSFQWVTMVLSVLRFLQLPLSHERFLWRIWIMTICPVHDVPIQSAVSWIRRGLAGCWPCFSESVTSPVAGGLASGSTAAWPRLWGDVTHWAWQRPGPQQSAAPLDTAG